jgi:hypothetical protein
MAIASTAVWEVRPTVGSNTNGGGFDPDASGAGTDYSQQNAKNTSGNNISTTDAVCTGGTGLTSATASFTSAIVGNIIYLSGSGVTTGWYEVTGYSSGLGITLDRSPGTFTGATMNIGGALADVMPGTTGSGSTANSFPWVNYNTIWIKATGAMSVTDTLYLNGNSGAAYDLSFIGYGTARGDGVHASWTTAIQTNIFTVGYNYYYNLTLLNIAFSSTNGSPYSCLFSAGVGVGIYIENCTFDGFYSAIDGSGSSLLNVTMVSCEVKNCTNNAVYPNGNFLAIACYFHSNTSYGAYLDSGSFPGAAAIKFSRCVFAANGVGVQNQNNQGLQVVFDNCAFYDNTGDGYTQANNGNPNQLVFQNCIFYGNGGYGINFTGVSQSNFPVAFVTDCAFGDNTSGARANFSAGSGTDITLTADPFTSGGTGDFSLNSTTGGGTSCKGAGFPSSLP